MYEFTPLVTTAPRGLERLIRARAHLFIRKRILRFQSLKWICIYNRRYKFCDTLFSHMPPTSHLCFTQFKLSLTCFLQRKKTHRYSFHVPACFIPVVPKWESNKGLSTDVKSVQQPLGTNTLFSFSIRHKNWSINSKKDWITKKDPEIGAVSDWNKQEKLIHVIITEHIWSVGVARLGWPRYTQNIKKKKKIYPLIQV